jgi:hypothetical protein
MAVITSGKLVDLHVEFHSSFLQGRRRLRHTEFQALGSPKRIPW